MLTTCIYAMLGDMDLTMLRQMSRRARVHALLHEGATGTFHDLANVLEPAGAPLDTTPVPLTSEEAADILKEASQLKKDSQLTATEYQALGDYLHSTGRPYRASNQFPHPPGSIILPNIAKQPRQIHRGECTFSTQSSHYGNSAIQFYNPSTQTHNTGFIQSFWQIPIQNLLHTFVVVQLSRPLTDQEEGQAPFTHYPGLMSRIVDAIPSQNVVIIEPHHIITHLTTYRRPAGTYGIMKETLVICWALNRGRY